MTEQLPISINMNSELVDKFPKIASVINKLEAQFNFHTLTANWYGDEENIFLIQLALETPMSFSKHQEDLNRLVSNKLKVTNFSDDVTCCFDEIEQQLICYVAITTSEQELLTLQPKLLAGYLQAKLHKVLNLIAKQQSLASI